MKFIEILSENNRTLINLNHVASIIVDSSGYVIFHYPDNRKSESFKIDYSKVIDAIIYSDPITPIHEQA